MLLKLIVFAVLPILLWLPRDAGAPIPVRFVEGTLHGFLVLSTVDGAVIASGDLRQTRTNNGVENRTVFHFKDGSLSEETVVFTQERVFSMKTYQLLQRGPAFTEDTEISLDGASGKYLVKTRAHKDSEEKALDGAIELPPNVYNGMVFTVAKNLPSGKSATVHFVAFTPAPRLIQLELIPAGEQKVLIGGVAKSAVHYVLHPQLGTWLKFVTRLLGRMPSDNHVWILAVQVPAFVRFEGPLFMLGPVWRIELTSPDWPHAKEK